jgi:hypothetical protein
MILFLGWRSILESAQSADKMASSGQNDRHNLNDTAPTEEYILGSTFSIFETQTQAMLLRSASPPCISVRLIIDDVVQYQIYASHGSSQSTGKWRHRQVKAMDTTQATALADRGILGPKIQHLTLAQNLFSECAVVWGFSRWVRRRFLLSWKLRRQSNYPGRVFLVWIVVDSWCTDSYMSRAFWL